LKADAIGDAALRKLQFNHSDPVQPRTPKCVAGQGAHDRTRSVKFQPDSLEGVNTISRHDGAEVWVGPQAYRGNLIVPWTGPIQVWDAVGFSALTQAHFDRLLQLEPELVIFGSGARLRFPPPALLSGLIAARVGVESMDTAAACRTYNVLVSERRTVVAALLLEPASAV
jgi:uncharacterized protein